MFNIYFDNFVIFDYNKEYFCGIKLDDYKFFYIIYFVLFFEVGKLSFESLLYIYFFIEVVMLFFLNLELNLYLSLDN